MNRSELADDGAACALAAEQRMRDATQCDIQTDGQTDARTFPGLISGASFTFVFIRLDYCNSLGPSETMAAAAICRAPTKLISSATASSVSTGAI